jgi:SAM-dependent methyltransferase
MDTYARQIAAERSGGRVDIRFGKLPDEVPFERHSFDLVCLFDVLEHVEDDASALVSIRELVRPGGFAVITVPAYRWLWSQHDEKLHHRRRYTYRELHERAKAAGWTVRRLSFLNTLLFPLAAAGRLLDQLRPGRQPAGAQIPAAPLNEALYRIFGLEKYLLSTVDLPFGVSLLAILTAR